MPSSKILLFGASGQTGRYVTKFALEQGYEVIAFVRSPQKLTGLLLKDFGLPQSQLDAQLKILEGDLRDDNAVRSAVRDSGLSQANNDVVVNCAGKPKAWGCFGGEPLIPGVVVAVVETMREVGLKRFLNQMGAMTTDPRGKKDPSYVPKKIMVRLCGPLMCIRGMVTDNELVAPYIYKQCADLEWIVSRPGLLVEKPSKCVGGKWEMGVVKKEPMTTIFADLGAWTLRAVFDDSLVQKAPIPGHVKKVGGTA